MREALNYPEPPRCDEKVINATINFQLSKKAFLVGKTTKQQHRKRP
jgi:hypothetical protein